MDTFCVLPFAHLNIHPNGQASVCCVSYEPLLDEKGVPYNIRTHRLEEIWNSKAMAKVRAQLLGGQKPPHCQGCYAAEHRGEESRRQIENSIFLDESPRSGSVKGVGAYCAERENVGDLKTSREELARYIGKPWNFDLRFDNICNLKCVICGGHSSSRIESDPIHMAWTGEESIERQPNRFGNVEKWIKSDELLNELIDFGSEVKYLQLAGGEPFRSKLALEWMAHLGATGKAKDVTLRIFTNLQLFSEPIIKLLMPFKKIHMILSIDATGPIYEYVRYPGKWSVIEDHARVLMNERSGRLSQVDVTINATMSAQSASRILDVFEFGKAHRFGAWLGNAVGPAHASTNYLPNRTKTRLEADLRAYASQNPEFPLLPQQIDQAMDMMKTVDITDRAHARAVENLMKFNNDMDASRGLSFKSVQPLLYEEYCAECGGWKSGTRFVQQRLAHVSAG